MLHGIVQTHIVGSAGAVQTAYPESVRLEAARYFRTLVDELVRDIDPNMDHAGEGDAGRGAVQTTGERFETVSERTARIKDKYGDREDI